jgi:plasmid maintenance system antidote protein VapI
MKIFDKNTTPALVLPPGATIRRELEALNISHSKAAKELGLKPRELVQLLSGELELTKAIAEKLENLGSGSAIFWLRRQEHFIKHSFRGGARKGSGPKPLGLASKHLRISAAPEEIERIAIWLKTQKDASRVVAKLLLETAQRETKS